MDKSQPNSLNPEVWRSKWVYEKWRGCPEFSDRVQGLSFRRSICAMDYPSKMFGLELDTRPGDRKVANSLKNQLVQKYGLSIDFWLITPTSCWPVPLRGEKNKFWPFWYNTFRALKIRILIDDRVFLLEFFCEGLWFVTSFTNEGRGRGKGIRGAILIHLHIFFWVQD